MNGTEGSPRIAVLGLGEAGGEIARDLVAAEADVRGYDPKVGGPGIVGPGGAAISRKLLRSGRRSPRAARRRSTRASVTTRSPSRCRAASGGHWTSPPLTDRSWCPMYEAMVELDVPAMVHVSAVINPNFHATGSHYLNADTTAFMQLLEGDLFTDFPGLRLVIPHGGGAVPYH